ncbi:MAG TPA: radical SAM family heme chaperone HemW [Gammaproteobacteria bacterium]|nr:radical SAM family heme chaperone HemW [Gammaproteobacteria bacterium]
MLQNPPLSLYVHLPWCVRKCPYCDFNSHALRGELPQAEYAAALLRDLDQDLPRAAGRPVQTVFFGGGTPSLFQPETIAAILGGVRRHLVLIPDAEITLEANPGTVERGRFAEYRAAGITRLSIGVQSFNARHLQVLGRIHSVAEAVHAAEEAHAAGLENFNLDLMYGLPEQNAAQAEADVLRAFALHPAHISHYQLTLEPNTLFHAHPPELPDEDCVWEMQQRCQARLAERGYAQYEISAYARAGRQCRHNLNYWRYGDYLGIGAGAHGKFSDARAGRIVRLWKVKHPMAYLDSAGTPAGIGGVDEVHGDERIFEFMLNRLRLTEGFNAADFETATGLSFSQPLPILENIRTRGMMEVTNGQWKPSRLGFAHLNDLQAEFLPSTAGSAAKPASHDTRAVLH